MDWNEHERLFNSIQIHKIQVKEQLFCCCSAFHIQIRVFNNYHHPYPKRYMKRLSPATERYSTHLPQSAAFWHLCRSDATLFIYIIISDAGLLKKNPNLTNTVISVPRHYMTRLPIQTKRQPQGSHQENTKKNRQFKYLEMHWQFRFRKVLWQFHPIFNNLSPVSY
jgi:hypothetical protein